MSPTEEYQLNITRRQFFGRAAQGIGVAALAGLVQQDLLGKPSGPPDDLATQGVLGAPHFAPKAKRVIYLFQGGAPSQMDLFDYKPQLDALHNTDLPDSVRMGQRLTGMSSGQKRFPVARSAFKFSQHGTSGQWLSELLPHTGEIADDICIIKSLHTEAINHDPAITFFQTGSQQPGRPCMGSWVSYGLGSDNDNLPAFTVLVSGREGQPVFSRLWGSGFLPTEHQGVRLRAGKNPVFFLNNPDGIGRADRRRMLDLVAALNEKQLEEVGDPDIAGRISQYEMAYRMQASVPELTDLSDESENTFEMYGPDARKPGSFAANCLLARRLAERGVRFIQLYHRGWDQHGNLPNDIARQCRETDQPSAALIKDLKQRGMLEDTLVIWGGEFGRTVYCQGPLTPTNYGRDHHPRCFTKWMAGGGVKPGMTFGETDDYSYNITRDPVHVHDFHATIMHLLGVDHERLNFKYQGRRFRLTDIAGELVKPIMA